MGGLIAVDAPRPTEGFVGQLRRLVRHGAELWASSPLSTPELRREFWVEVSGGHPVETDPGRSLMEAIAWLERAQDAGAGGIARGYSLAPVPEVGDRGWQDAYPETTGYIIPTLYAAAWIEERPWLAMRATCAARWELTVQRPDGSIPAGMVGQVDASAVFNTGQVIFGWLCALREVGDDAFADATKRAAHWLAACLDPDGFWRNGDFALARSGVKLYNARTAWALLAAGRILDEPEFIAAGHAALYAVVRAQHPNGWLPECCLTDPDRPLTHTLAYTIQGLLEGGVLLQDDRLIRAAARAAGPIADAVRSDGFLPGRLDRDWTGVVSWSCLTGTAQMANVWFRLAEVLDAPHWRTPAAIALKFLERTQNRSSDHPGLRGGIKGSHPCTGAYGRLQTLSWATKFYVDALLRSRLTSGTPRDARARDCLALA